MINEKGKIEENFDYYLKAVKTFRDLLECEQSFTRKEFLSKLSKVYDSFKIVLPLEQRLELNK